MEFLNGRKLLLKILKTNLSELYKIGNVVFAGECGGDFEN